jgi:hypothetical protein
MAQSRSDEAKAYRLRKKSQLGQSFNDSEALKRKLRRQKNKPAPTALTHVDIPETKMPDRTSTEEKTSDSTLDTIYESKKRFAEASGHTIKKASVETALNKIKRLHKYMYNTDMINFIWVEDTTKVIKFILTSDRWNSEESRIQQLQSLASILKVLEGYDAEYQIYSRQSVCMRKQKTSVDDENLLNEREKVNILPWNEILKLNKKTNLTAHDAALIAVYTMIAPRRVKDFQLIRIATDTEELDKEYNYVILNSRSKPLNFVFNNFKTSKTFGSQRFKIPRGLSTKLKIHIDSADLHFGDFLFGRTKSAPYASFSSQITKVFKKYTGKAISVNLLRHSMVSNFLSKKRSIAEKKDLAFKMSQSVSMQMSYDRIDLTSKD